LLVFKRIVLVSIPFGEKSKGKKVTRQEALLVLGLNMTAREAEIKSAWRKKAKFFHPDSPYGNVKAFLQAKSAYETLVPPAPAAIRIRAGSRAF